MLGWVMGLALDGLGRSPGWLELGQGSGISVRYMPQGTLPGFRSRLRRLFGPAIWPHLVEDPVPVVGAVVQDDFFQLLQVLDSLPEHLVGKHAVLEGQGPSMTAR